jgi:LPS O-antigen subunit length determinant protein (WzzB/FepE family)
VHGHGVKVAAESSEHEQLLAGCKQSPWSAKMDIVVLVAATAAVALLLAVSWQ